MVYFPASVAVSIFEVGMVADKVRENRLRRAAQRQGLHLTKSRYRDPRALGYGEYGLIDPRRNAWVVGARPYAYSMSLDDVEAYLTTDNRD